MKVYCSSIDGTTATRAGHVYVDQEAAEKECARQNVKAAGLGIDARYQVATSIYDGSGDRPRDYPSN